MPRLWQETTSVFFLLLLLKKKNLISCRTFFRKSTGHGQLYFWFWFLLHKSWAVTCFKSKFLRQRKRTEIRNSKLSQDLGSPFQNTSSECFTRSFPWWKVVIFFIYCTMTAKKNTTKTHPNLNCLATSTTHHKHLTNHRCLFVCWWKASFVACFVPHSARLVPLWFQISFPIPGATRPFVQWWQNINSACGALLWRLHVSTLHGFFLAPHRHSGTAE